jgi:NAD(P)-dependent dehydrogenase (short-subunit alcohol dehydrogenase family)
MIGLDLSGKTALVCGAGGGGLGSAVSRILAQAGANLVAVDQTEELVAETKAEAESLGVSCHTIAANLMDAEVAAGLVAKALTMVERIDIVVNVAGGTRFKQWSPIEETTDEVLRDAMALNLNYVFRVCADTARHMIASGHSGSMVNLASIAALHSAPFHGPYGMAKRGVMSMTETMALEWARYGIRVNTVAPGGVATPRASKLGDANASETRTSSADGMRRMEPNEVASAVAFLVSGLASGVSGQTLFVDGAMSCKNPAGGVTEYTSVMNSAKHNAAAGVPG